MPIRRYDITHTTVYRYREPVSFGLHRLMFRPRDSHDLRVLATDLQVSPTAIVRMIQDVHSNSIALVQPLESARELRLQCAFTIEQVPTPHDPLELDASAQQIPFDYAPEDRIDLEPYLRPRHGDPEGALERWARQFLGDGAAASTREVLARMNAHIGASLRYTVRNEEDTQTPLETLARGSGTCRDYARLMMEAARRLGIAARFVSGYLYDAALDPTVTPDTSLETIVGAGSTHAWLQLYLPGAGWVEFDPTNNLTGVGRLIRVGVARDPEQATPVAGSWFGPPEAYLGMEVQVQVRRSAG